MKKLHLSFSFHIKKPADSRAMIRSGIALLLLLYSVWLLWLLYHTIYPNLIVRRPLDPTQVTAKQEQVNRKLLDTITAINEQKRNPADFQDVNDPFLR